MPPESSAPATEVTTARDLRGVTQLVADAVLGVTTLVEQVHAEISDRVPLGRPSVAGRTRGVTGAVYRSVRGVTRTVAFGMDRTLAGLTYLVGQQEVSTARREAFIAALNGAFGDHLAASCNPLAIPMQLRAQQTVEAPEDDRKLLVVVHGLCMNDRQWQRNGHDHGAAIGRELGYRVAYLHYNSGRPIAENGREFARQLEQWVSSAQVPVEKIVLLGHSMGGLVSRSASHHAVLEGHAWVDRLDKMICLGTPHHGAPLERAGSHVDRLLEASPYTAPFSRLGRIRSAGVQDLRHGRVAMNPLDEDSRDPLAPIILAPAHVRLYAVAASRQAKAGTQGQRIRGDGLVPVASALGQDHNGMQTLGIPAARRRICYDTHHLDLLDSPVVYRHLRRWIAAS